jgi:hypothetical protein
VSGQVRLNGSCSQAGGQGQNLQFMFVNGHGSWVFSCMRRLVVTRHTAMESVRGGGPTWSDVVRHDSRLRRKLRELPIQKRNLPTCRQESYLWGLGRVLTTRGLRGRKGGDGQLRVLLELLSRRLSHHTPNLSRRLCALTRYDIQGLTACGIWLRLARLTVLWIRDQLCRQGG